MERLKLRINPAPRNILVLPCRKISETFFNDNFNENFRKLSVDNQERVL
jgi:hypothetical protein